MDYVQLTGTEMMPIRKYLKVSSSLVQHELTENMERGPGQTLLENREPRNRASRFMFRILDSHRFEGWKFTLFLASTTSLVILFFNMGFLLYCLTNPKHDPINLYPVEDQAFYLKNYFSTTIYEGDCTKVHRLSTGFHLIINILSTGLLGASNYGMVRREKTSVKGQWLDIGVPSARNLFRVSVKRSLLWFCLAISSLPFHLLYNSAIYPTTSVAAYDIFAGPPDLGMFQESSLKLTPTEPNDKLVSFQELYDEAEKGTLYPLSNTECFNAFAVTFQSAYKKLLLVTDTQLTKNLTDPIVYYMYVDTNPVFELSTYAYLSPSQRSPYQWLCDSATMSANNTACSDSTLDQFRAQVYANDWNIDNSNGNTSESYHIQSCMAEKAGQYCKLRYSFPLVIVVIGFNLVKTAVLLYMWLGISDAPILTIGDAIASFLRHPDPESQNLCLLTSREAKSRPRYMKSIPTRKLLHQTKVFGNTRWRWSKAVSTSEWVLLGLLWVIAICTCILLLAYGVIMVAKNDSEANSWTQPLGTADVNTLIYDTTWPSSLVLNAMIANSPQVIFSLLYFICNGQLTAMTLAAEWSSFAKERKGLRVSNSPKQSQRSKYFLSIPFRYAAPLMAISALLHWLISQSLFVIGVEAWNSDMLRDPLTDFFGCGWSPVGTVSVITVGSFMFLSLLGLSYKRFNSAMPVAGSCSLAIAAACHPRFDPNLGKGDESMNGEDMSLLPVQWGSVPVNGPVGHCSFTSGNVKMPQTGEVYL
ncbi:hypothetical protein N7466_005110 [Penicillium verhagenii]|uniref:uncharacterized protein n=1 Tax=Penicillium verhagenii TaxID=1562060 RepID=UPI002545AB7F|nr:uncharacterized protein N7466_005110 [Penicillium verhagenii]KAJ5935563.1 hypothetical protein N7466_005110 [Penicillium verhagenii]